jgi:hypothetical protein
MMANAISTANVFIIACYVLLVFLANSYLKRRRRLAAMPPGPRRLPIIGNLLDIPREAPWKAYAEWGKRFGSEFVCIQQYP